MNQTGHRKKIDLYKSGKQNKLKVCWGQKIKLPFPHDQTQLHHHKGLDEDQEGSYHPLEHLRKVASFSLRNAQCHMRKNQPNLLQRKNYNIR